MADRETIARSDDHRALRIWLRLLTCTQMIEPVVRSRLRERFATTLPRFDLMAQLERHPEGLKTVEHVCVLGSEKAAWFQDPEGNILCLHEDLS